jgi:hypothetical protein
MARITKEARKHAERRARSRGAPLDGLLDDDDELGSTLGGIGRLAGGIAGTVVGGPAGTAIGSSLGGALGDTLGGGGGKPASTKPKPSGAAAAPTMVMSSSPEGPAAPTRDEIRGIVQDALASSRAEEARAEIARRDADDAMRTRMQQLQEALDTTARATRGGISEQRLQTQATQEHRSIQRREARERLTDDRYTQTQVLLSRILDSVGKVQQKLSGRVAVVRGRGIDVLGGDSLVRTGK